MDKLTLIIGNKTYSSWSLRPWVFLKHHNIPFDEQRVCLDTKETKALLRPYFSDGKVPVLQHNERSIWDSLAILEYCSEQFSENAGWPKTPEQRGIARAAASEMHASFPHLRNELPMNCRKQFVRVQLSESVKAEVERIESLWEACRDSATEEGPWLMGPFGIVDAMFVPVALRFWSYDVELKACSRKFVDTVLGHVAVQEWILAARKEAEVLPHEEVDAPERA